MVDWIKTAEVAELIFYSILLGATIGQLVLRLLKYYLKLDESTEWFHGVLEWMDSLFIAILLAFVIRVFLVQAFKIPSGSMENTLLIGDHLLVNKFIYGSKIPFSDKPYLTIREPKRGDIIVFKYPENIRKDYIKRCVGLPGDKIEVKNKDLYVNDQFISENFVTYRDSRIFDSGKNNRDNFGPVVVPENQYFMMGDNRDQSMDSRFWGFLPRELIKGKAWIIYWPIHRWRLIK